MDHHRSLYSYPRASRASATRNEKRRSPTLPTVAECDALLDNLPAGWTCEFKADAKSEWVVCNVKESFHTNHTGWLVVLEQDNKTTSLNIGERTDFDRIKVVKAPEEDSVPYPLYSQQLVREIAEETEFYQWKCICSEQSTCGACPFDGDETAWCCGGTNEMHIDGCSFTSKHIIEDWRDFIKKGWLKKPDWYADVEGDSDSDDGDSDGKDNK